MIELFSIFMNFLNSIPTNAAMVLILGIIGWLIKYQDGINKENTKKFASGTTNFTMINEHFEDVKKEAKQAAEVTELQFAVLHEQLKELHKMVLKDIIYNDSIDFYERQAAYDEYILLGGNGFTERYYENVLRPKIEQHIREGNR